jgi:hypothetical protein
MSAEQIVAEREPRYGGFTSNATTAQDLKDALKRGKNWGNLSCAHREALEMIAVKVARILNGDPHHVDNWDDIGGYAALGKQNCLLPLTPPPRAPGTGGA